MHKITRNSKRYPNMKLTQWWSFLPKERHWLCLQLLRCWALL